MMYALVRFVEEKTDKRYVIPVADITNFKPKHDLDFDNTVCYDAFWLDEEHEDNSGIYAVQVLKLAARKKAKQHNQATARKQQYESVLRQHMKNSLGKNRDVAEIGHNAKAPAIRTSTKSSQASQLQRKLCMKRPPISEQQPDGDFVATPDGRFHLSNGIYISASQADKLFKNKKPSILVRGAAQVVWGDDLAKRSVSGRLAPTKSGTDEQPAKQLTPAKLNVIYDCLRHWGRTNSVDIRTAELTVPRTLTEKIQDVKRKLRHGN
ncbi:hypothetical protein MTO96_051679 [Rhipicephalus appendiculatus]